MHRSGLVLSLWLLLFLIVTFAWLHGSRAGQASDAQHSHASSLIELPLAGESTPDLLEVLADAGW